MSFDFNRVVQDAHANRLGTPSGQYQWGQQSMLPFGNGGNYNFFYSNPYAAYDAGIGIRNASAPGTTGMMSDAFGGYGNTIGNAMGQIGSMLGSNADRQQTYDIARMQNDTQMAKYNMLYNLFSPMMRGIGNYGGGGSHGSGGYVTDYGAMNVPSSNPHNLLSLMAGNKLINNMAGGQSYSSNPGNAYLKQWAGLT